MQFNEHTICSPATLYEMRRVTMRLLGKKYAETMAGRKALIERVQARLGCDPLPAAIQLCQMHGVDSLEMCLLFSSAVELIDPSVEVLNG